MGYSPHFISNKVISQLSIIKPEEMELISHNRGARANRGVSANLDPDWCKIDWIGGWSTIRKSKSQRHFYNVNFSHLPHKDIQVPDQAGTWRVEYVEKNVAAITEETLKL